MKNATWMTDIFSAFKTALLGGAIGAFLESFLFSLNKNWCGVGPVWICLLLLKIRKVFWGILLIRKCWLYLCIRQRGRGENTWSNFKRLCTVATWWGVCRSWCRWRRWWRGGRGRSRSCKPCGRCHSSGKGCNSDLNSKFKFFNSKFLAQFYVFWLLRGNWLLVLSLVTQLLLPSLDQLLAASLTSDIRQQADIWPPGPI